MQNSEYIIQINKLTKVYSNNFRAISNLTLNVPKGVFGLLGPNGSGKTTLVEILVGAIKPTSGSVYILGHNIARDSIYIKRQIGYLPENPGIYKDISGLKFLQYMGELSTWTA